MAYITWAGISSTEGIATARQMADSIRPKRDSHPQRKGKSKWEKFREAWCQMACPHDENGPSKIVTPRSCDKGPVRLPICPSKLLR